MQPDESGREDILREATALVQRIELQLPGEAPVVAGFRRNGSLSIFFDADPVYQFNANCQLRRIYLNGKLVKAEGGQLVSLRRERRDKKTVLWRTELAASETAAIVEQMHQRLQTFYQQLCDGAFRINGQIPPDEDISAKLAAWLDVLPQPVEIAAAPHV